MTAALAISLSNNMKLLLLVTLNINGIKTCQPLQITPWSQALVDYSGANEYVAAHYNHLPNPYFGEMKQGLVLEDIYDARKGIYINENHVAVRPASLSEYGFELLSHDYDISSTFSSIIPSDSERSIISMPKINWNDINEIRNAGMKDIRCNILPKVLDIDSIQYCVFWNPTVRGEDVSMTRNNQNELKTSSVAATVHIDTDVGACEDSNQLVGLLLNDKNRVHEDDFIFDPKQVIDYIDAGHRFLILNFWRNISNKPIENAPLGLFYPVYKTTGKKAFPDDVIVPDKSRWYTFPFMTSNECLVFKQYDRDDSYISDIWHTGLSSIQNGKSDNLRRNFDVRAFIILKEKVNPLFDRFSNKRQKSNLTLYESECFCDQQEKNRSSKP